MAVEEIFTKKNLAVKEKSDHINECRIVRILCINAHDRLEAQIHRLKNALFNLDITILTEQSIAVEHGVIKLIRCKAKDAGEIEVIKQWCFKALSQSNFQVQWIYE